jgi:hypothetical protein
MLLHTKTKNMFGVEVGISTVFTIFGHFWFKRGQGQLVWSWPTHHLMLLDTITPRIYIVLG